MTNIRFFLYPREIVKRTKKGNQVCVIGKFVCNHLSRVLLVLFLSGIIRDTAGAQTGQRVYVTNHCRNTVSVIDTATNTVASTITVGNGPYRVAFTPDGTRAYVPNIKSDTVSVINTATNTVVATIPVGIFPFGAAITADGSRAYVTNINPGTVSVIDTANNTVIANAPAGECPFGIAISPLVLTAAPVTIRGRIRSASGRGIFRAMLSLTDNKGNTQTVYTNSIGYYQFESVAVGKTYNLTINAKHYKFAPQVLTVNEEIKSLNFTASNN